MSNTLAGAAAPSPRVVLLTSSSPIAQLMASESAPPAPAAAVATSGARTSATTAETRVLVVEDERIVGLHLRQQLVKLGYKVVGVVSSGDEALRAFAERSPDIVLMDIHIEGGMDGIETAKMIPQDFIVPVIYLTAYSADPTLERARTTKPYGYLLKPFGERELHATIQMALARSRSDQEANDREDRLLLAMGLASGSRVYC